MIVIDYLYYRHHVTSATIQPMQRSAIPVLFFIFFIAITASCTLRSGSDHSDEPPSGEFYTLSEAVPRGTVTTVTTHLSLGIGELIVFGGSDQLLEADFEYSQESWQPAVSFAQGKLTIDQPELADEFDMDFGDNQRNVWRVRLNNEVAQTLECEVGAGETNLDLRGMSLRRVDIDAGVGEHRIILTDTSLPELTIDAGVGEVNVDLRGEWRNHLRAEIDGGIGELNLLVPPRVGVRLDVSGGLGSVDVPSSYEKSDNVYTNAAYDQAEYRLEIDIDAGMGSIEVAEAE